MFESLRNKRILVVAAHPDDEVLGQGASMHRLIHEFGCIARAVILGEGITSRGEKRDPEAWKVELALHRENIRKAGSAIGYQSSGIHDFPDNRFDSVALLDIIKTVEAEKRAFDPDFIFTHHASDLNIDHRRTFEAVITATRPLAGEKVRGVLSFETPSATEWQASTVPGAFRPNVFLGFSAADLAAKTAAMESYELESRPFPHPRSPEALEALAKRWGAASGCGLAEAFELVRWISG